MNGRETLRVWSASEGIQPPDALLCRAGEALR
jgi:hypothetical protein